MKTLLIVASLALMPATSFAQDDPRWLPWLGCWQSAVERLAGDSARVCFVPSGAGVKMLTVVADDASTDQVIVADAIDRALEEPSCSGFTRAEWSKRASLLYTRASLNCSNSAAQKVWGLHLITAGPTWIDIQAIEAPNRDAVRTRRYARMSVPASLGDALPDSLLARASTAAERLARTPLSVEDIIEASGKVASSALEAALFETKTQFALTSRNLLAMSAAAVPERVIDLMLAISYPKHFAVSRWATGPQSPQGFYGDTEWDDWSFSRPLTRSHRFSRFGFYESPYGSYAGWELAYFPRGNSHAEAGSFTEMPPPGTDHSGRVIKGQGYTRARSDNSGSVDSPSTGDHVSPASRSSAESGSGSHDSNASSAGYSSGSDGGGGSASSGGRTAVER
jgi:hypothetical protein